jgi:hypothetical protein
MSSKPISKSARGLHVTAVGFRGTLNRLVRECTTWADGTRKALQTSAERRPITPCSFPPGNKRPALPSMVSRAVEPLALSRAYSG